MSGHRSGDIMINVPGSIFANNRRNGRDYRRNRQIQEMLAERESTINHLFSFKMHPVKEPETSETRPLPKCCKTCLPDAEMVILEEMKHLGLRDCFIPPTLNPSNSMICRIFPFSSHYRRCIKFSEMHNLPSWKELEQDPNLFKNEFSKKQPSSAVEATKQEVLSILTQLQVTNVWRLFSTFLIRLSCWICQKYLSCHFESVLVHAGQIELLRDVHSRKLPVVYVPIYRSKFDKILIMWTLAHHGFRTPLFIRNHREKKKILKYFGGIGAELQVNTDPSSEKKYCSAVAVYIRHLLRKGNSIMLNLESCRSRCGRPDPNVYGTELLKVIYDEYRSNKIEDVYFVPVSVSYELLPDAQEIFEGYKKQTPRSLLSQILEFAYGFISPNPLKGKVKIDFAQPTCFRELHSALKKNVKIQRLINGETESYFRSRNCNHLRWNSSESLNSISSLYGELAPLYPDINYDDESYLEAILLDVTNHHLVYDGGKCESIMPTHLVAFILMKKFRSGVFLEQLTDELQWLVKIVQDSKKDFGFFIRDCDMESIAFRATEMLKDDIICQWIEEKKTYKFEPRHKLASLLRLEYYANYLLPLFMMEAIVATAIFAITGTTLNILRGFETEISIGDSEFILHCRRVYEVLTGGFLLHPPCLSLESAIRKQISQMSDCGMLTLKMRDTRLYMWEDYLDDDDDDVVVEDTDKLRNTVVDQDYTFVPEEVKITTSESTVAHLSFYRTLLMPYFEIIAFLILKLDVLLEKEEQSMNKNELEKYLLSKLISKLDKDFSHCQELCNMTTVKQFLATCEDHYILDCDMESKSMNLIYKLLKSQEELKQQSNDILFYVTI